MARTKFNLKYWSGDARQLLFWVTVALTVGAIPDLSVNVSVIFLLVLWVSAAVVAALMWHFDKRKVGVGVFVHLPRPGDKVTPSDILLKSIQQQMSRSHRGWFRSGPSIREGDIQSQVDWALATIDYRLNETKIQADYDPTVFLYLHCRLEEAFMLGQRVSAIWDDSNPLAAPTDSLPFKSNANLAVRVRSISTYKDDKGEVFELDFNKVRDDLMPDLPAVQVELEQFPSIEHSPHRDPRLAVVLYAAEQEGNFQSFKNAALNAASGHDFGGYVMRQEDICDRAVILSITSDSLINSLRERDAEKFVRQISRICQDRSKQAYGSADVPIRLFMQGPAILAFAAGVLFPAGSRLVPWDARIAKAKAIESGLSRREVIAIIDGDDVGSGMEQNLLNGDLVAAAQYSKRVDEVLVRLIAKVQEIPGVELVSSGGDSAIFGLAKTSLEAFEHALQVFRSEHDFKVSCGYGRDSKQAFFSLRMAKTSGKNVTRGQL